MLQLVECLPSKYKDLNKSTMVGEEGTKNDGGGELDYDIL
jgi:hypothetical protein